MLGKIISSELLLEIFQNSYSEFYRDAVSKDKSKHWKKYYDSKEWTKENLESFRGEGALSLGLDDSFNFPIKVLQTFIEAIGEDKLFSLLDDRIVGNADLCKINGVFLDYHKFFAAYWFDLLNKHFENYSSTLTYLEIGSGMGQLAELFLRDANAKVILIDLPEGNLLASYYLKELHPEKNFYLYDGYSQEGQLSKEIISKYDIFILPPSARFSDDFSIDIAVNTRSMMEMEKIAIEKYFVQIQKHIRIGGLFLNVNRYEKNSVGYPIRISEYPYDGFWKVLVSQPNILQEHIHLLLTSRTAHENIEDIKIELKRINEVGRKFHFQNSKARAFVRSRIRGLN